MTSIQRLDRSLANLRKILADRPQAADTPAVKSGGAPSAAANAGVGAQPIKQRIKSRIASLDLTLPEHRQQAANAFLETVLAEEFGSELLNDPGFYDMLAEARQAMMSDAETQANFMAMLAKLKDSN